MTAYERLSMLPDGTRVTVTLRGENPRGCSMDWSGTILTTDGVRYLLTGIPGAQAIPLTAESVMVLHDA